MIPSFCVEEAADIAEPEDLCKMPGTAAPSTAAQVGCRSCGPFRKAHLRPGPDFDCASQVPRAYTSCCAVSQHQYRNRRVQGSAKTAASAPLPNQTHLCQGFEPRLAFRLHLLPQRRRCCTVHFVPRAHQLLCGLEARRRCICHHMQARRGSSSCGSALAVTVTSSSSSSRIASPASTHGTRVSLAACG